MRVEAGDIIFATSNEFKFQEASLIAESIGLKVVWHPYLSVDIQSSDVTQVAIAKAQAAYARLLRPLFIDQTSLHLDSLHGFPGGTTEYFLSCFDDEQLCAYFGGKSDTSVAEGRTTLAFCDGRRITTHVGSVRGHIVPSPRGASTGWDSFGWNRVFAPEPGDQTFAEMGLDAKNAISMRRLALQNLFSGKR